MSPSSHPHSPGQLVLLEPGMRTIQGFSLGSGSIVSLPLWRSAESIQISLMGRQGGGGQPAGPETSLSHVISAISTNSRLRIRLTSLVGREAAGMYGPGLFGSGMIPASIGGRVIG